GALMRMFADRLQQMVPAGGGPAAAMPSPTPQSSAAASTPPASVASRPAAGDDEVLDVLALAGGMSWAKALPTGGTMVAIAAALVSVFAAGYASAKARSIGR